MTGRKPGSIARTDAAGGPGLLEEVLAFSSSLALDRALWREDLVGSLAHLEMLARQRIIPEPDARALRQGLVALYREAEAGTLALPEEEDVHMAVEAALHARLGAPAGLLHTARSRNDQVALDLRLYVRERCAEVLNGLGVLVGYLADRAEAEREVVLPSYTHRQRAMPISLGYLWCGYAAMFQRDAETFRFALGQADRMPLGVGAVAGTSLPIDREHVRARLGFGAVTLNGLDTVGDRDFALDFLYAAARFMTHASRLAQDLVDFTTAEFGYARLDGEIACGSSMMPQKKNPDVFELVRGKAGRATGNLVGLLVTLKGLPAGYNRDLQEDRGPLLETSALVRGVLEILRVALPRVTFDVERCREAVEGDAMQATDLAEALVRRGVAFRTAYKLVGALVRAAQENGVPLAKVSLERAMKVDPRLDAEVLSALEPLGSVQRKVSAGSTGPARVSEQVETFRRAAREIRAAAQAVPRLADLFAALETPAR